MPSLLRVYMILIIQRQARREAMKQQKKSSRTTQVTMPTTPNPASQAKRMSNQRKIRNTTHLIQSPAKMVILLQIIVAMKALRKQALRLRILCRHRRQLMMASLKRAYRTLNYWRRRRCTRRCLISLQLPQVEQLRNTQTSGTR